MAVGASSGGYGIGQDTGVLYRVVAEITATVILSDRTAIPRRDHHYHAGSYGAMNRCVVRRIGRLFTGGIAADAVVGDEEAVSHGVVQCLLKGRVRSVTLRVEDFIVSEIGSRRYSANVQTS